MSPASTPTSGATPARREGSRARRATPKKPSLRIERTLHREGYALLAGMDEVGRGALAGPVTVGVVLVDAAVSSAPPGIRDSKLLPAPRRMALVEPVRRWARSCAVGHASAAEIDAVGIIAALRLAGRRALHEIEHRDGLVPDLVLLDGKHDWLSDPPPPPPVEDTLFADLLTGGDEGVDALTVDPADPVVAMLDEQTRRRHAWEWVSRSGAAAVERVPPVRTLIKADMSCSSVAAASILAKVERDHIVTQLAPQFPEYCWELNKGYAAPEHREALLRLGPCEWHRRSWNLLGPANPGVDAVAGGDET